ncbi:hypothetical protein TRIATDRAFT_39175 [Trichoderma atroviride IMI 206040]|uniref:Uncharacterized protein n=1 Tax=Hypocrea atroviridis (strain ATCC 20476 / IMI 206040) TaxID=452589 RepID=G9NWJ6_HYPAI|nr:uncharacterized protein TRIATDRAFT_39175 [Trichoderma atroviride IMI 206040]EHK45351.1 hypothetical protein TRIATDRAFT_39175 [Trichoderma atroviride IMI 206040]
MNPSPEIFDRLFKPGEDDIEWIRARIEKHLNACKRYLNMHPSKVEKALDEANDASSLAVAEGMVKIDRKIKFYRAECHRRLEEWREAGKLYEECVVDARDEKYLAGMRRLCRDKLSGPRNDSRLRHKEGCGNLRQMSRSHNDKVEV